VDETAEPVAATDLADGWLRFWRLLLRWLELEGAVRPLAVVVVDVDSQHAFEVTAVQDQQPVKTLGAHGPDETFGDRVRLRRPERRLHDADAFAARDLVGGAAVLAVAVMNQESDALVEEVETEVARLRVTQAPVGFMVQPASQTRRLACVTKKRT
jgi:hypothetical protein